VQIRQTVRIARNQPFELAVGQGAELVCWGVMLSGMLRYPLWLGWLSDTSRSTGSPTPIGKRAS
jgi:hypothetical protein